MKDNRRFIKLAAVIILLLLIVMLPRLIGNLGQWQRVELHWNYIGVSGNYIIFAIYILIYRKTLSQLGVKLGNWKVNLRWYVCVAACVVIMTRIFDLLAGQGMTLVMPNINTLFFQFVFVSLGEELFYRGLIQTEFGYWPATILFGAVHLLNGDIFGALAAGVLGGVFGWVRRKTDSVLASALLHGLVNLFNVMLM